MAPDAGSRSSATTSPAPSGRQWRSRHRTSRAGRPPRLDVPDRAWRHGRRQRASHRLGHVPLAPLPRWIPTLGLVGAPLLLASCTATLFGVWEQISGPALLLTLPIAVCEFSFGIYMTVKGFKRTNASVNAVDDAAAVRTVAA